MLLINSLKALSIIKLVILCTLFSTQCFQTGRVLHVTNNCIFLSLRLLPLIFLGEKTPIKYSTPIPVSASFVQRRCSFVGAPSLENTFGTPFFLRSRPDLSRSPLCTGTLFLTRRRTISLKRFFRRPSRSVTLPQHKVSKVWERKIFPSISISVSAAWCLPAWRPSSSSSSRRLSKSEMRSLAHHTTAGWLEKKKSACRRRAHERSAADDTTETRRRSLKRFMLGKLQSYREIAKKSWEINLAYRMILSYVDLLTTWLFHRKPSFFRLVR